MKQAALEKLTDDDLRAFVATAHYIATAHGNAVFIRTEIDGEPVAIWVGVRGVANVIKVAEEAASSTFKPTETADRVVRH